MSLQPATNDTYNDLLYKLASNLYAYAVSQGASGVTAPLPGWTDFELLKNAVDNTSKLLP
jgi:hypothetical protein